ncbi:2-succinyl-5-enolpyruvyl-6-hydroxy-3-cyclohexene-1-carboxylic-acid synthase [Vibrio scophthalmi]|uniref:2-succinyl-5-enolpyruvyl-6-hydroxy-3- cyclohexene-1-carboxylic-acid synthase n=1 Tax=Vibrio scophthalmi TaxID=45658 RepID=UPI00228487DE|nr:2-succinyl-5-enolpyruvyl-6-hydroxy-3-cyclohexene-1-carboxylic-acid synthase [Vibrio scophthalmi]MCY9802000.1 2-succinyl-5-enolpyruvyl-6-hydroxy-3-cyclohexene-1-carboxylic-acid synthase [Vibrio scophthalmi]
MSSIANRDQAVMNRIWCQVLLEELTRFEVEHICVAPGSRSTPLTLEADENPNLTLHTHYDERGLGFLALGLAKASRKPVAIVVTSGTAVANLLPAIAEAKLTGEKLVVLTADRPVELVACGANQAIVQQGIFSSHVTAALNLPSPNEQVSLRWLLTSIDDVMYRQDRDGSAVHINCAFPEPLYSKQPKSIYQSYLDDVALWQQSNQRYSQQLSGAGAHFDCQTWHGRKGLIVVGSVSQAEAKLAQTLAQRLGWPILCDVQSGTSSAWAHFDIWLQSEAGQKALSEAELVLQVGSRVISKRLNHWLSQTQLGTDALTKAPFEYHYLSPSIDRNNQDHLMQIHHHADTSTWLTHAIKQFESDEPLCDWANELSQFSSAVNRAAKWHVDVSVELNEVALATTLNQLPSAVNIFLGNSLFVRLVDMFGEVAHEVYSNRGASGIDGLVATAAGTARATNQPTVLYIGDTSLLYDLNSLALFTHQQTPCVIVVTNNDGGAIFGLLPVPEQQKQQLYQMPHGYDFSAAAAQFKLAYYQADQQEAYQAKLEQHLTSGQGCLLIEVTTPPEQASAHIKEVVNRFHASL